MKNTITGQRVGMPDQPILSAEVHVSNVVKTINNNKSSGSDGIAGELIKYGCTV